MCQHDTPSHTIIRWPMSPFPTRYEPFCDHRDPYGGTDSPELAATLPCHTGSLMTRTSPSVFPSIGPLLSRPPASPRPASNQPLPIDLLIVTQLELAHLFHCLSYWRVLVISERLLAVALN